MSLRLRFAVLTTAGLIAAGYTAALAFEPLCSVFRSTRHYSTRAAGHATTAPAPVSETSTALAAHH
jgi:hypothetical protein